MIFSPAGRLSQGWGSTHQDRLYVAAMCSQAAMPIYAAPILGAGPARGPAWPCPAAEALRQSGSPSGNGPGVEPSPADGPPLARTTAGYWATKKQIKPLLVYCQIASFLGCLLAAVANRPALILLALNMMAVSGYSTQPVRGEPQLSAAHAPVASLFLRG